MEVYWRAQLTDSYSNRSKQHLWPEFIRSVGRLILFSHKKKDLNECCPHIFICVPGLQFKNLIPKYFRRAVSSGDVEKIGFSNYRGPSYGANAVA